jgi:hypothetical protein
MGDLKAVSGIEPMNKGLVIISLLQAVNRVLINSPAIPDDWLQ